MTFAHYQQLQAAAKKMIAEKIASIQPRGGNQVSVVGDGIAIESIPRDEGARRADTWEYVIYGTIKTTYDDESSLFGPALAGYAPRAGGGTEYQWVDDAVFVRNTQVFTNDLHTQEAKVTYNITTTKDTQRQEFEAKGIYRGGLKLICLFFEESDIGGVTPIREYNLLVGRNGDSVRLTAPESDKLYYLRIVRAESL
jgi:hypothetical protein